MSAIDRVYELLKEHHIKPTNFEKEQGISSGYFAQQRKRQGKLGEDVLVKIIVAFPEVDIRWLLTGERNKEKLEQVNGASLKNRQFTHAFRSIIREEVSKFKTDEIERLKRNVSNLSGRIQSMEEVLEVEEKTASKDRQSLDADSKSS